jgi:predicted site-specific integrase-resolvase
MKENKNTPNAVYVSKEVAAKVLKISVTTLLKYTRHGLIKLEKISSRIFYRWSDVDDLLSDRKKEKGACFG